MSTWQITALFATAACAIGCLLGICIAIVRLSKGVFSIGAKLTEINAKIDSIEALNDAKKKISQGDLVASIEGALRDLEKL